MEERMANWRMMGNRQNHECRHETNSNETSVKKPLDKPGNTSQNPETSQTLPTSPTPGKFVLRSYLIGSTSFSPTYTNPELP